MGAEFIDGSELAATLRKQLEALEETITKIKRRIQDNEDTYDQMSRTRLELQEVMSLREQQLSNLALELPGMRFAGSLQEYMRETTKSSNAGLLESLEVDLADLKKQVLDDDSKLTSLLSQKSSISGQLAQLGQSILSAMEQFGGD